MVRHGYSLMRGGLVHRLLQATGVTRRSRHLSRWIAATLLAVGLLPLMLLCARSGWLWARPSGMALLGDYTTLARLLLALPLLVVAAPRADALLHNAFRQLSQPTLVPPRRQPRLAAVLSRVQRGRDGWLPEACCLVIAWLPPLLGDAPVTLLPGIADWRMDGHALNAAGHWHEWVSLPLYRLVLLLWWWRFVLWIGLLWRLPRIGLTLRPQHPDGAGGLGFLGLAQERFAVLSLVGGLLVAGACLNQMTYLGASLYSLRHLLGGYVVGATLVLVAPLLLLAPPMLRARRHALFRFDALGARMAATFDARWHPLRTAAPADSLLDHGDPSALADFNAVYQGVAGDRADQPLEPAVDRPACGTAVVPAGAAGDVGR
ncbi:hypothetical protein ACIGHF_02135 [Stenotrophomonas sp. NPDC077464]|uniref:hypothetical protein n=1 Tax=unclassified Stenotrophomonas TaxID=196198 RepID=UPI0037D114BC